MWQTVCVIPAVITFCLGICLYKYSDDAPRGNYSNLKKNGNMPEISAATSFRSGTVNFNSWFLFIQYVCCFGFELTMNNAAAFYIKD
jgi:NNP family nitrate/nitrite transporter-like MFS transporter